MGKINLLFAVSLCLILSRSVVFAGSTTCPPFDLCNQMGDRLCQNGGTCTYLPDNCIECHCAPGWTGTSCGEPADSGVLSSKSTDAAPVTTTTTLPPGLEARTPDTRCAGRQMCSEGGRCEAGRMSCLPGWGPMARGCCMKCTRDCYGGECLVLSTSRSGEYEPRCVCPADRTYVKGEGCVDICSVYPDNVRCTGRKHVATPPIGAASSHDVQRVNTIVVVSCIVCLVIFLLGVTAITCYYVKKAARGPTRVIVVQGVPANRNGKGHDNQVFTSDTQKIPPDVKAQV